MVLVHQAFHIDSMQNRLVAADHLEPGGRELGGWKL
jgi:hypothetical protein